MSDLQSTALTLPKPRLPKKPRKPTLMSHEEATEAASQAGFILVNGRRLAGSALLGKYIREQGPLEIARGWYAFVASEVQHAMGQCDGAIAKNPEPEVEVQLLSIKKGLIGDMLLSANGMVNSAKVDMAQPPPSAPPIQAGFGPGTPVQINIGTNAPPQFSQPLAPPQPIGDITAVAEDPS